MAATFQNEEPCPQRADVEICMLVVQGYQCPLRRRPRRRRRHPRFALDAVDLPPQPQREGASPHPLHPRVPAPQQCGHGRGDPDPRRGEDSGGVPHEPAGDPPHVRRLQRRVINPALVPRTDRRAGSVDGFRVHGRAAEDPRGVGEVQIDPA